MAPPTSIAWKYFTIPEYDRTAAECHLCKKFIRIVKNTSPMIAHLRCRHPEVLQKRDSVEADMFISEMADMSTQTCPEDFPEPIKLEIKEEDRSVEMIEYDMNSRVREMAAQRLDDAVEQMKMSSTTEKYPQLVRLLVESCLWLIRDWPGEKMDESIRTSRKEVEGRLRGFLRVKPPRSSEMETHLLLLSDAMLAISEQWPVDGKDRHSPAPTPVPISAPQRVISVQKRPHPSATSSFASAQVNNALPPAQIRVYGVPGTSSQQPAAKITRIVATPQQLAAHHNLESPLQLGSFQSQRATSYGIGSPARLWSFFTKMTGEAGQLLTRCTLCRAIVPRQNHRTTAMNNHLKICHPREYTTLDSESSGRQEPSHASPQFVSRKVEQAAPSAQPSSFTSVASLHDGTTISLSDEESYSPLFDEANVKEEEVDFEEEMEKYKAATGIEGDPEQEIPEAEEVAPTKRASSSAIWTHFTEKYVNGDQYGTCMLCGWSRRMYNHGTNSMWTHLNKTHPVEYYALKPNEYHPALHGQYVSFPVPGAKRAVPGVVPAEPTPRPVEAGEELKSRASSAIWTHFTEKYVNKEQYGTCMLCGWSRRMYNHGTHTMWTHLNKTHPVEYYALKPNEYHPALHGQYVSFPVPGSTHSVPVVVPGDEAMVPDGSAPRPVEAGEELVKEEEM